MKRILIAVDGSDYGMVAVRIAAKIAVGIGAPSVTVINVIPLVAGPMGPVMVADAPGRHQRLGAVRRAQSGAERGRAGGEAAAGGGGSGR